MTRPLPHSLPRSQPRSLPAQFPKAARYLRPLSALFLLSGCAHSPAFNVLGSYFPGWIACIIASILLTALLRWGIKRAGLEHRLPMLPLLYFSLALGIASTLWLLAFE